MREQFPDERAHHSPRTEAAPHRSEWQFRRLLERLPAGAYTCNPDGLITYFNQNAAQLWGRSPRLLDPEDRWCGSFKLFATDGTPIAHDQSWMALALKTNGEYNGREIIIERPDGGRINALAHANPIHDESGKLQGAFSVLFDVTERKRAEEDLRLQHVRRVESLELLAGGIAHDFNNLLTTMLGYASLAMLELPAESVAHPMLREIEKAALRAADLSRQMLAYSGRGKFEIRPLRLDALVQEMAKLLETVVSRRATLHLNLSPASLEGDAPQLCQVVMNLLTNASDALEGRGGAIHVRTGTRYMAADLLRSPFLPGELPAGDYAFVEVEDNGCGMTAETLSRIFDPFFTTKFTGRGLGLAAVLGIVKGHRGAIKVSSTPEIGTVFQVFFPCGGENSAGASIVSAGTLPSKGQGMVLVVEDEPSVRLLARRVLENAGFKVREAVDGRDGLEVLGQRREEIVAVLVDLTMPRLDGLQMLRELRRRGSDIPVLVMSGYNEVEVATRFEGLGVNGFIQKPFTPRELTARVCQLVSSV